MLGAETSAAWREVILRFEAQVADDPALAAAVMECAEDLERHGRQDDAQILRRWHTTVQRRVLEQRMMAAVPDADDAELDELVRRVPSMATPENVEQGLAAVRELSRRDAPTSPRTQADAARPVLGFCLRIAKRLDRPDLVARTLMQRAWLAMRVDEPAPALADLQAAAAEWRSAGNAVDEARCLSMAGDALLALDRPADAAERMREAVRLLEGSDEHVLLAATYDDLWAISDRGGEKEAALAYLELGAFHRIAAGQAERAVPMLGAVIGTRLAHDDTSRALPAAERLVDLWEQRPDLLDPRAGDMIELILQTTASLAAEGHAETFLLLQAEAGHPVENGYRAFVDPEKLAAARRWYALAKRAGRLAPGEEKEAWLAYFDALLSRHTGDLERVVRRATEALPFFDANDHHVQSIGLREAIYEAEGERGELARAVAWCDDVLARLDAYGDDADGDSGYRASCLMRRGQYLLNLGRPQAALDDLNDALRLIRADPDAALSRANEGPALALLAAIHEYLGDLRAALEADRDALLVARRINHRRGEAHQLAALGALVGKVATGWLRARLSHADAELMAQVALQADPSLADAGVLEPAEIAAALLGRAAQLFAEINDTAGWTVAAVNLCNLLPDDEADRKVELLSELVQAKAAVGDRLGQAVALANLGAAHKRLGHTEQAVRAWKESLTISRPAGYFQSAAQAARDLAGLRRDLGDAKAAEAGYREAVQMIEAARSQLPLEDRARVGFVRNKGGAYTNLVDLLVAREAHDEAFEMVQRAKSRALLDFAGTGEVRPTITPRGRAAELFDEERRCLTRLRGARPSGDTVEGAAATMARLDALYGELAVFDPEYIAMRRGTPATVAELRTWLRAQGRPVLLVEYFLSDGWLTLFFLRAEWEHVRVRRLACTPDEIAFGYDDFLHDVVRYRNHSGAGWTRLARLLTEPLAEHLRPGDLVYLIPHRRLHSLPLHALPLDDDPLIAGHPVVYAPTSGLLPLSQNAARGTGKLESCASFGVVFEEEAREVAALFGAQAIGPHGLHSEVVEELCAGKDVCHFSCHGYFNPTTPMLSGLVLQPNGKTPERQELLTAQRVMSMRLRTELVCISACESASSEIGEGDELLGLIRAFLHAGASSLVASLWAVDADSTRDLMVAFYQRLLEGYKRDGTIAKADALRGAQLQLMEEVGAGSSFYWAPFALVGNWR